MEDSEQRKKRLKEMRMQADLAEVSDGVEGPEVPGLLSNPLIEASSTAHSQDSSYATPRFDYYTDPMNAFFSSRRGNAHNQPAPNHFPPPNLSISSVAQFSSPHPVSTNSQMYPSPTQVLPEHYRSPIWNGPRGPAHHNFPFRPSSGGAYPRPRFEPSGGPLYNAGQGIMHRPSHNPYPSPGYRSHSPGRGRGFWHNNRSPFSGQGSVQGPTSRVRGHWSNEDRGCGPDWFHKQSMVEDPWKFLTPVIWKAMDASLHTSYTPENSKPWTSSKSVTTKREGSSAASAKPNSEPSLAEYLAIVFNEAANDAEDV